MFPLRPKIAILMLLTVGLIAGSVALSRNSVSAHGDVDTTRTAQTHAHTGAYAHGQPIEISDGIPYPFVHITVNKDPMAGWNLHVQTLNFRFAPELASTEVDLNRPIEGHAHLFIDGEKITRLYGPWYYINKLSPGTHEITVTLNGNNHGSFMKDGQEVGVATVTVTVEE